MSEKSLNIRTIFYIFYCAEATENSSWKGEKAVDNNVESRSLGRQTNRRFLIKNDNGPIPTTPRPAAPLPQ